mgnify:CR=1 FL=1
MKLLRVGVNRAAEELAALANTEVIEVTGESGALPDARVYVGTEPGVQVFSKSGQYLGTIPTSQRPQNLAFAGPPCRDVGWLPFVAIVSGRQIMPRCEIVWWRLGLALLVYASFLCLHPIVIGRDPLAGIR